MSCCQLLLVTAVTSVLESICDHFSAVADVSSCLAGLGKISFFTRCLCYLQQSTAATANDHPTNRETLTKLSVIAEAISVTVAAISSSFVAVIVIKVVCCS